MLIQSLNIHRFSLHNFKACSLDICRKIQLISQYCLASGSFVSNLIPPVLRKYNFCSQQVTNKWQRILIHIILSG